MDAVALSANGEPRAQLVEAEASEEPDRFDGTPPDESKRAANRPKDVAALPALEAALAVIEDEEGKD